jgi:hypothetical protein
MSESGMSESDGYVPGREPSELDGLRFQAAWGRVQAR